MKCTNCNEEINSYTLARDGLLRCRCGNLKLKNCITCKYASCCNQLFIYDYKELNQIFYKEGKQIGCPISISESTLIKPMYIKYGFLEK